MPSLLTLSCKALRNRQSGRAWLPVLVSLVLLVALVWRLTLLVTGSQLESAPDPALGTTQAASHFPADLALVQGLGLMSGKPLTASTGRPAAAQTRLDLTLDGVMLASEAARSRAIIVSGGRALTLAPGDSLPDLEAVQVESIASDHVLLSNRGLPELLWLDTKTAPVVSVVPPATSSAPPVRAGAIPGSGATLTPVAAGVKVVQELAQQRRNGDTAAVSASLAQLIQISPAQENGQLIGYRLSPGSKQREFLQLGFRANDLLTEVNGLTVSNMQNLPALYALMNEATEVSFSLLREGQPLTLEISLAASP